mgnify:CR=1 FL=1
MANGRLQRLHHGVYALGHTALRVEGRWRAAALAGGAKSALSHQTALLALGEWAPEHAGIHLTTTGAGRSRGELRLHRSALHPADVTVRHGLRVTTLERALVDCADELDWQELLAVADRICELSPIRLAAARERAGARRGARRTRLLLAREEPHTRSEFERAYLRFGRRHKLPRPAGVNVRVGRWVVDVLLDGLLDRLVYLSIGLAVILGFIGVKLVLHWAHGIWAWVPEIPTLASLGVIIAVLVLVTFTSLAAVRRNEERERVSVETP